MAVNWSLQVNIPSPVLSCTALLDDITATARNAVRNGMSSYATATVFLPATAIRLPSTIPPGGSIISPIIPCIGMIHMAAGVRSTQNGAISIQRYFDTAGLIAVSTAITGAITGPGSAVAEATDSKACSSFQVTITNTGAAVATLTGLTVMLLTK